MGIVVKGEFFGFGIDFVVRLGVGGCFWLVFIEMGLVMRWKFGRWKFFLWV